MKITVFSISSFFIINIFVGMKLRYDVEQEGGHNVMGFYPNEVPPSATCKALLGIKRQRSLAKLEAFCHRSLAHL